MIIQDEVEISLNSNQTYDAVKYWTEKGYTNLRPQQKLTVKVSELPKFSGAEVLFKCDDCGKEWIRRYSKKFTARTVYIEDYCYICSRRHTNNHTNKHHVSNKGWMKSGENHPNWNPNKSDFLKYAYAVRRVSEETYNLYQDVINPQNLPRTLCGIDGGYQLDHKISIKEGYDNHLNPEVLGHITNLQMLPWEANRAKWF